MARRGIEVEGARELRAALKRAGDDASDLKDAHHAAGEVVVTEARSIVPHLSGRLEGTIRASRAKASATVKAGGAGVPYAGVQHFGWPAHGIEAVPFLYDALDRRRGEVVKAYEDAVAKITDRI